jgi:hypothetical protein
MRRSDDVIASAILLIPIVALLVAVLVGPWVVRW